VSRYDAFLSYSHEDSALADRLSRRIRSYRPPRAVRLAQRKLDVFRDVERLTASADLSEALEQRMGASEHLVLLASPGAAKSRYVDLEVAAFLGRKDPSRLLVVLCRGDLAAGLPPSLKERAGEPLFIDLRDAGRKRFRLETLRLIAALFGVDYSELRRQDDERRRRRRNSLIAAVLGTALAVASAWLVSTTPAEVWFQEPQPERPATLDPLLPVQEIAVRRDDPAVVVWYAANARYARDLARAKTTWKPGEDLGDFEARAAQRLRDPADLGAAAEPLAVVTLEALEGGKVAGTGELRLHGFLEDGKPRFARSFAFAGATGAGRKRLVLPLTALAPERSPFDLEPWPAAAMEAAGFDTSRLELRGRLDDRSIHFFREDDADVIREGLDATASPEHAVLASSPAWQPRLEKELEDAGGPDFWQSLAGSAEWAAYSPPETRGPQTLSNADPEEMIATARKAGMEESLARAVVRAIHHGEIHDVWQVSRRAGRSRVSVATMISSSDFQEEVKSFPPLRLYQAGADRPWRRIDLPLQAELTRVVDVLPLDDTGTRALLLTDREGFFRTTDGGATWHDANFNEPRLRNGEKVRTVTAGPAVYALAVLHTGPGEDPNPLFRLKRRNWLERWRAGLAGLLRE
jgi:hypothetical protein